MIHITNYLNDGACWQAKAVLAYIRELELLATDVSWNGAYYDLEIDVERYQNGAEQGYIFCIAIPYPWSKDGDDHCMCWAVYEYRSSLDLCVTARDIGREDLPNAELMGLKDRDTYDIAFEHEDVIKCAKYVISEMEEYVSKYYKPKPTF